MKQTLWQTLHLLSLAGACGLLTFMATDAVRAAEGTDNVMIIRTMTQVGFKAKFNLQDPKRPGVCLEIMQALEKQNLDIRFVGLHDKCTIARAVEDVKDGKIDMFCGIGKLPERMGKITFVDDPPVYVQRPWLLARADDPVVIHNYDDIRKLGQKGIILSLLGNKQTKELKEVPGIIVDDGSKNQSDNLRKLLLGRGRFYFGTDIAILDEVRELGIKDKVKFMPMEFEPDTVLAAFYNKAPPEMIARFQSAMKKLERSGELKRIQDKYLKVSFQGASKKDLE